MRCRVEKIGFGIYLSKNNRHIGIIIGEKDLWGQGIGQEAIELLADYAFKHINLKKVWAGIYANDIGSCKAFLKAEFKECGRQKDHFFLEGHFVDGILVEKINQDYKNG